MIDWNGWVPEIISEAKVTEASREVERRLTHKPIKDELELGPLRPESFDVKSELTSDEESELPGTKRPRKGAGWWGQGHPIRAW